MMERLEKKVYGRLKTRKSCSKKKKKKGSETSRKKKKKERKRKKQRNLNNLKAYLQEDYREDSLIMINRKHRKKNK